MAKGIAHRDWQIRRDDFINEYGHVDQDAFRAAIEQEMVLNVHMMERQGVAIISAPKRTRDEFGNWSTEAYVFQTATVPAARTPEATPDLTEIAVEDEPEPVAAE